MRRFAVTVLWLVVETIELEVIHANPSEMGYREIDGVSERDETLACDLLYFVSDRISEPAAGTFPNSFIPRVSSLFLLHFCLSSFHR